MAEDNNITLYKYVSSKFLIETLKEQQLYLDDGSNFNDPFELRIVHKNKTTNEQIKGLHILCLTNSYRKKLMWSHYGESHKGACLTIEVPKERVYPICYTSKRVCDASNLDTIIAQSKRYTKKNLNCDFSVLSREKKIALLKDKKWSDEREYRIVLDKSDEEFLIKKDTGWFLKVKIKNVYLGARFADNEQCAESEIKAICKSNGISVKHMILSKTCYSLDLEKENN